MFQQTEFRFYWAQTKVAEQDSIAEHSRSNPVYFITYLQECVIQAMLMAIV